MSDWRFLLINALFACAAVAWVAHFILSRKDKGDWRRERVVAHLIESYRNIEIASHRKKRTPEMTQNLESSIATIFLLGSASAASEVHKLGTGIASGDGNIIPLLQALRRDIRGELGLDTDESDLLSFRFDRGDRRAVFFPATSDGGQNAHPTDGGE